MANPGDPGGAEFWITDRIPFDVMPPRTGDTGTAENWITDRIPFWTYGKAVVAALGCAGVTYWALIRLVMEG